ncbi:hypothetical protein [Streptomyces sp. NPDC004296]
MRATADAAGGAGATASPAVESDNRAVILAYEPGPIVLQGRRPDPPPRT